MKSGDSFESITTTISRVIFSISNTTPDKKMVDFNLVKRIITYTHSEDYFKSYRESTLVDIKSDPILNSRFVYLELLDKSNMMSTRIKHFLIIVTREGISRQIMLDLRLIFIGDLLPILNDFMNVVSSCKGVLHKTGE